MLYGFCSNETLRQLLAEHNAGARKGYPESARLAIYTAKLLHSRALEILPA